jgi:hypothetical protein
MVSKSLIWEGGQDWSKTKASEIYQKRWKIKSAKEIEFREVIWCKTSTIIFNRDADRWVSMSCQNVPIYFKLEMQRTKCPHRKKKKLIIPITLTAIINAWYLQIISLRYIEWFSGSKLLVYLAIEHINQLIS